MTFFAVSLSLVLYFLVKVISSSVVVVAVVLTKSSYIVRYSQSEMCILCTLFAQLYILTQSFYFLKRHVLSVEDIEAEVNKFKVSVSECFKIVLFPPCDYKKRKNKERQLILSFFLFKLISKQQRLNNLYKNNNIVFRHLWYAYISSLSLSFNAHLCCKHVNPRTTRREQVRAPLSDSNVVTSSMYSIRDLHTISSADKFIV